MKKLIILLLWSTKLLAQPSPTIPIPMSNVVPGAGEFTFAARSSTLQEADEKIWTEQFAVTDPWRRNDKAVEVLVRSCSDVSSVAVLQVIWLAETKSKTPPVLLVSVVEIPLAAREERRVKLPMASSRLKGTYNVTGPATFYGNPEVVWVARLVDPATGTVIKSFAPRPPLVKLADAVPVLKFDTPAPAKPRKKKRR